MNRQTTYCNGLLPPGRFVYGIHKPSYRVANLRLQDRLEPLGLLHDGSAHLNRDNFPAGDIEVRGANWIYEIRNVLPFRGTTYIDKSWADIAAMDLSTIALAPPAPLSFRRILESNNIDDGFIASLPRPLLLTLATCSNDALDLQRLARLCCEFIIDTDGTVTGLRYRKLADGRIRADIFDHDLFEAVANNPALPDDYKRAMVLRPGAQGASEIVGEWRARESHVYEYMRRNSYIAGGHFAANMADDAVRYSITSLTEDDMHGLRHLYYQRLYVRLAELLGVDQQTSPSPSAEQLEELRLRLLQRLDRGEGRNLATLWGWNFGFDYAPTDYRLHASHQQIHQQYAVVPEMIDTYSGGCETPLNTMPSFSCGDLVAQAIDDYARHRRSELFRDYYKAVITNERMDQRDELPSSLVVWQDDNVLVFVPKAQTSQWELQIMTKPDDGGRFPGNIVEADGACRASLDIALLKAQQVLARLGARLVTSIEYAKRIAERQRFDQPLLYALLPKLPFAPGAFSEAQLRFINRHYPEDFAAACRKQL